MKIKLQDAEKHLKEKLKNPRFREAYELEKAKLKAEIPNKKTLQAMKELQQGKGKRYKNLDELYKDLDI